jgi:hypothetical protein
VNLENGEDVVSGKVFKQSLIFEHNVRAHARSFNNFMKRSYRVVQAFPKVEHAQVRAHGNWYGW